MKIIIIKTIFFFLGLALIVSCGGDGGSDSVDMRKNILPETPKLTLPFNRETCSDYTVVVSDATKAEISFSWATTANTTSYVLVVNQAGTTVVKQEMTTTSYKVVLDKGKTYSWTVTAKNRNGETISATYSFTTPGVPVGNYVPYAAIINFSVITGSSIASLSWVGKDEDSSTSELKYDVEISKDNDIIQSLTNQTVTSIPDFAAVLNSTYQIKINTIDKQGSYSTSIVTYIYQ
nr:hypothetical protein [uncultured Flavobacterium sp.]